MGIVTGVAGSDTSVLVIGAGPAGLFAALQLTQRGVPVHVIEREPRPHRQARATALQPGTLEILTQAGLADEFARSAVHLGYARVLDPDLTPLAEITFAGTGSPWEFECSLPQWRTEEILARRLADLGGTVEHGTEVVTLQPKGDRLLADLCRPDGSRELAEYAWVIGAGGAHSITRQSLTGDLAGETYPGTALAGDVQVACGLARDSSALIASPDGYVLLAPLPGDRWITFIGDLREDEIELLSRDRSQAAVAACIRRRVPDAVQLTDIRWASTFRMHRRMAPQLAGERWFLLGDAGHLSSPFGGEGLNSGLHDAHNLAWKLALEIQGHAKPGLVASYASERETAAAHVLEVSDRLHQMARAAVESARTGVRGQPLPAAEAAAFIRARAMLDVCYDGSLTGSYGGAAGNTAIDPGTRYPGWQDLSGTRHHLLISGQPADTQAADALAAFDNRWRGLVDVTMGGNVLHHAHPYGPAAVLVRPDGIAGFVACPADADGLQALDAHLSSYLIPPSA